MSQLVKANLNPHLCFYSLGLLLQKGASPKLRALHAMTQRSRRQELYTNSKEYTLKTPLSSFINYEFHKVYYSQFANGETERDGLWSYNRESIYLPLGSLNPILITPQVLTLMLPRNPVTQGS